MPEEKTSDVSEEIAAPASVEEAIRAAKENSLFMGHPAQEVSEEEVVPETEEKKEELEAAAPPPAEEPPAITFKYKSQEEAEKAHKEAERLMHERAEEAKRERERSLELERQLNELRSKPAEKKDEEIKEKKLAGRIQSLLNNIEALDPEEDGYQEKIAELWGSTLEDAVKEGVLRIISEREEKEAEERRRILIEEEKRNAAIKTAEEEATKAGLDMAGEQSEDRRLFWAFAVNAPQGTLDSQIAWTVNEVKQIKASLGRKYLNIAGKAQKAQDENSVLERQGAGRPAEKPEPAAPVSLSDALKQTQRRI